MKKFQLSAICALILSLPFSLSYAAWGSIEPIEPDTENYQQKEPDYGYLKNGIF